MDGVRAPPLFIEVRRLILSELTIQKRVAERLGRTVASGRTAQAYLFDGLAGVGKLDVAKAAASAFICREKPKSGCGECADCKRVAAYKHPDFLVYWLTGRLAPHYAGLWPDETAMRRLYEARCAEYRGDKAVRDELRKTDRFLIESVRDFQAEVGRPPSEAPRKVYALLEPERMTDEAANALLKTLEEPPPRAVFFLLSHDTRNILDTIISRCTYVRFPELTTDEVARILIERYGVGEDDAKWAAERSSGTLIRALGALDEEYRDLTAAAVEFMERLTENPNAAYCLAAADAFTADRDEARAFLRVLTDLYRDLLVAASGANEAAVDRGRFADGAETVPSLPLDPDKSLRAIDAAADALDRNCIPRLTFENLFLRLAGVI
jgi:DNA polymerase-3 subunit delta'